MRKQVTSRAGRLLISPYKLSSTMKKEISVSFRLAIHRYTTYYGIYYIYTGVLYTMVYYTQVYYILWYPIHRYTIYYGILYTGILYTMIYTIYRYTIYYMVYYTQVYAMSLYNRRHRMIYTHGRWHLYRPNRCIIHYTLYTSHSI